ncbi:invasion associated locus B family protein [Hoeflea sp. 108]|uniref:invasion associated locus B family protein n=1 Tax=Hoeflea sp. 108 TaxID=1116369 RepID=UPI000368BC70|nr:invasion associated locus B family protein [Hoeflea sp. 108]
MKTSKFARHLLLALIATASTTAAMAQSTGDVQGPSALSETYEAWTVQCANRMEGEQAKRSCQMSQELLQQGTGQRVLMFALGNTGQGAKATMVLPFGLRLSDGVRVSIAEEEVLRGAFRTCLPAGCVADIDLAEELLGKLANAETASVLLTADNGQPVKTDVSLKGFKPAYQRLVALAGSGK